METLILKNSEVAQLIDMDDIHNCVKRAYMDLNSGLVVQPDILNLTEPGTHKGFDFKCGLDLGLGYYSMKSSSGGYTPDPAKGTLSGYNTVYLYKAETSELACMMEGNYIRNLRTAAAASVSIELLSRKDSHVYFAYGAGRIGKAAVRMTARVRELTDVYVYGWVEGENDAFINELQPEFPNITFHSCATIEEGARAADIIVTVTLARSGPQIKKEWLKPGTHLTTIGADGPDKQEIYADILADAKVVNDCIAYASKNGETYHGIQEGYITVDDIYGEIGEIALGQKPGRENDEEITVFDTVGMAVQDMAMAVSLYNKALEKGIGLKIDLMA